MDVGRPGPLGLQEQRRDAAGGGPPARVAVVHEGVGRAPVARLGRLARLARLARRCPAGGDGDRRPEGVLEEVDGVARRRDADGGDGLDAGQLAAGDGGPGGQGSAAPGAPGAGLLQAPGEEQAGPGRDGHQGHPERPRRARPR